MMMLGAGRIGNSLLLQVFENCSADVMTVQLAVIFSTRVHALS